MNWILTFQYLATGAALFLLLYLFLKMQAAEFQLEDNENSLSLLDTETKRRGSFFDSIFRLCVFLLIWALWPLLFAIGIGGLISDRIGDLLKLFREWRKSLPQVEMADLVHKCHIDAIERDEYVQDPMKAAPEVPFGFLNPRWREFQSLVAEQDQVWSFDCFEDARWGDRSVRKRSGYAIVRGRRIVAHVVIRIRDISPNECPRDALVRTYRYNTHFETLFGSKD